MATLALAAVGAAAGSALLPAGVSVLGFAVSGATIGAQIGAFAGSYVDNALFGTSGQGRVSAGPRLADLHVTASTEGAPIPRLYGRARLGGQIIWAADIREEVLTTEQGSGKGMGASRSAGGTTIEYRYYASFAVALAEGEIGGIGRVWVDGDELDLTTITYRLYRGTETQAADSLISAHEGADAAPAYRGLAYVVFDDMPLLDYGNRIPQLSFEVYRSTEPLAERIKAAVLIPGAGEFVYADTAVSKVYKPGFSETENVHTRQGGADWPVALDQMTATLPALTNASLIVSWFGTDLRAGSCQLKPSVELADKTTEPLTWSVAGVNRAAARVVSTKDGRPAYGGTPSDQTVISAIQSLRSRGIAVTLTPFILMDIPSGNALADPYSTATSQPAYPWRGRITVSPAPGRPGTPDKTSAAASQIAAFVGTAQRSHFSIASGQVVYTGPAEWSLRRMVLHYAYLAAAAGGVSAFVIGSELRGLSQVRSASQTYPFVTALAALAADVKAVLGTATKVTYAADWSEYFGHQPADGSGDVLFHLDPLWASTSIDAIGIDCYWPLADWRDGTSHLDYLAGHRAIYDLDYLRGNVQAGEGYDWYYASDAARRSQTRTPITDGAGKPWVFRYKDVKNWWLNQHFNRPGGVQSATATAWVPQSKPVWFMEVGCPAIDKGANQPNVFVDPKSSESALPYFSRGTRDDLMQSRHVRAFLEAFDPASDGYVAGLNPVSAVTGQRMVDVSRCYVYCVDMRPYPAFPANTEAWGDGENWRLGHWLNGRLAAAPLADLVSQLLGDYGFSNFDTSKLYGMVSGFVVDRVMSARDALEPLGLAFFFDALETEGRIAFRHRGAEPPALTLTDDDLVEERPGDPLTSFTRAQETDLPASAKISYIASESDYRQAVAEARRIAGASARIAQAEVPIVLDFAQATSIAEQWLFEAWASRERAAVKLPPSALAIEPGDTLALARDGFTRLVRVTEIGEHGVRAIDGRLVDPEIYGASLAGPRPSTGGQTGVAGRPLADLIELPLLRGDESPTAVYFAASQQPWPGGVALYSSPETTGYVLRTLAGAPAVMGTTTTSLAAGVTNLISRNATVRVELLSGELSSVSRLQLLNGKNAAALETPSGLWEVVQFETATLVGPQLYELSGLIRGQAGTEDAMAAMLPAGARFVLIQQNLARFEISDGERNLVRNWRFGPANRPIGDATYVTEQRAFSGRALSPLAPDHIRARRSAGAATITWVRRTRIGGDSWEASDVPVAEESERYEVDILAGTTVKRTLSATSPSVTYAAADQIADFGAVQTAISVNVYQLSATVGRGRPAAAVV